MMRVCTILTLFFSDSSPILPSPALLWHMLYKNLNVDKKSKLPLQTTMICYHRWLFTVTVLLLLLLNVAYTEKDNHCADFRFSCKNNRVTMLEFLLPQSPDPIRLSVTSIDYTSQSLSTSDPQNCLPRLFLKLLNSSSSIQPFQFDSDPYDASTNLTFFDCSSVGSRFLRDIYSPVMYPAQDISSCPIYVADSADNVVDLDLLLCRKMLDLVSPVHEDPIRKNTLKFRWSTNCGVQNFYCNQKSNKMPTSIILTITAGVIVLVLLVIAFFHIHGRFKMKSEDEARVETFLKDYRALKPTRFSYADLKRMTNNFKEKLGDGAHGTVFKGNLSNEIVVAVKILNNLKEDGKEFINEVGTMGTIHHINVVRLLGFCADGYHRALVYDFFPNGSLQNFISHSDKNDLFLGWEKLQQIVIGIAKGIEYLHLGCDHRILHFDINPHNVLLDNDFTPKISDFGLAKLYPKNQSIVSMTGARGTLGYIAPEVFSRNFGKVSYKSDIYSYGMMLVEIVGGRKNTDANQEGFQILYPDWIHNLIEGRDIHIHIEDEEDIKIAKKLAIVGLWCIQWHPVDRPSIKAVVQMLEGEVDKLKVPPSPFDSTSSTNISATIPTRRLNFELEVIHELN